MFASCVSNSDKEKQILDFKISENITSLNFKIEVPNNTNTELKNESLTNWNSKGYFNKYKYFFFFTILYFLIGNKLNSKESYNIYDNRKTKTAYLYYIFLALFGGHLIYLGKYWKYWFHSVLILMFLYINTFVISNFYNNSSILIYTINENFTSKVIICLILIFAAIDLLTIPIQVFKINKSFRDNISSKTSKEREVSFLEIKKTLEINNNLMLIEHNQWKK